MAVATELRTPSAEHQTQNWWLLTLEIQNWKGCKNYTLQTEGGPVSIYGDNGVGKTTLFDAFLWLLFGRDSLGQADFEVTPLDEKGKPIHNLEHRVRAVLECSNGKRLDLEKIHFEKWTFERGNQGKFGGHEHKYLVNGVGVTATNYKAHIGAIFPERTLRLLSDPRYFNEGLNWKERRAILSELVGTIGTEQVIAANDELAGILEILDGRSAEEHRKIATEKRKATAERLKQIPTRIDEANLQLSGELPAPPDVAPLNEKLAKLQEEKAQINAGGAIAETTVRIRTLEAEAIAKRNEALQAKQDADQKKYGALREMERQKGSLELGLETSKTALKNAIHVIEAYEVELAALREDYRKADAQVFVAPVLESVCPACEQEIPAHKLESARAKAEADWNQAKSDKLEGIKKDGKLRSEERLKPAIKNKERIEGEIAENEAALATVVANIEAAKAALVPDEPTEHRTPNTEHEADELTALRAKLVTLQAGSAESLQDVNERIAAVQALIADAQRIKAMHESREQVKARIAALEEEEQAFAAALEKLDHELHLCETFIRTKATILQESIDNHFDFVRFRLFEDLVNGSLEEACEALVPRPKDGVLVPYSSANTGGRINSGLDIINTLARHYCASFPIFIDHAESVTQLLPSSGQQIRLVVSESDKALRIEAN